MSVAANGKTMFSISQAAQQLTRDHDSWALAAGTGITITYAYRSFAPAQMPEGTGGFSTFSPEQIQAAELALQSWADVANIQFTRIGSGTSGPAAYSNSATLLFANYATGNDDAAAFSFMPSTLGNRSASSPQGDSWFNNTLSYNANPRMYEYGQRVLVHEFGHALGLDHPGDYSAGQDSAPITYAADAVYYEDSRQYSVMSYFSESNTGAYFRGYYAASPLLHDIAAIQTLYGANQSAFLGDTIYGFGSNANRPWYLATTGASPLIFSVWDAGGVDTFNFSGYAQDQRINLNAGQFSDVGGLTGNVSIALGAVIENADGGSGADVITGNDAANVIRGMDGADRILGGGGNDDVNGNMGADTVSGGDGADVVRGGQGNDVVVGDAGADPHVNGNLGDDTVYGASGDDTVYGGQGDDRVFGDDGNDWVSGDLGSDTLTGGAGADRFLFRVGSGADIVTDFSSAEGDRVQLTPGTAFTVITVAGQAVVDLGGGNQLTLAGVAPASLGDWLVYA